MPFGRKIETTRLLSAAMSVLALIPRLSVMKKPLSVLMHYIRQTSPEFVELKTGQRFYFSSHPHDVVSFCIVFLKKEYGEVEQGDIVFDVGANVGSFSLYAAMSGAKKVYAFEPSLEAFQTLSKNIATNGFESVIVPIHKAVTDHTGDVIRFPLKSSPFNSIAIAAGPGSKFHADRFTGELRENAILMASRPDIEFEGIETIALEDFVEEEGIASIDILKLDCEGAEFSIVPAFSNEMIHRIRRIRMECHGDSAELVDVCRSRGFAIDRISGDDLWLTKHQDSAVSRETVAIARSRER